MLVLAAGAFLGAPAASQAAATADELAAGCPSAADVAQINADFPTTFEHDPTAPSLVCTAAGGSANLTRLQDRFYDAMLVMRELRFARPLPWTSDTLYNWLNASTNGIKFADVENSFCCNPAKVINLKSTFANWNEDGFDGLSIILDVVPHEARHAQGGFPHTCGSDDQTLDERGAWFVHFKMREWRGLLAAPSWTRLRRARTPSTGSGT